MRYMVIVEKDVITILTIMIPYSQSQLLRLNLWSDNVILNQSSQMYK